MSELILSIVVSSFNDAENLRATLESISTQTALSSNFEVVLKDGGSTDHTAEVADAYSSIIAHFVSGPDRGVYDGMNIGASLATGRWIQFLNAGDTFRDERSMSTVITSLSSADSIWAIGRAQHLGTFDGVARTIASVPHNWHRHALGIQPHCHQATWFRGDAFAAASGHDLRRGMVADHDLIMRLGLQQPPFVIDDVVVSYQGNGMSHERGREIPMLLHENRCARLQLAGPSAQFDLAVTRGISLFNLVRRRAGQLRKFRRR